MKKTMVNFKIVISDPKTKKAYQKEVEHAQSGMVGKKIGDTVSGNNIGCSGYEFQITGGSDKDGFPMRADVEGTGRKRVLVTKGTGFREKSRGIRKRKSIRGNTVSQEVSQINVKVTKYGTKQIEELLNVKAAEPKPEPKEETKPASKPEEKPASEPKAEEKAEEKPEDKTSADADQPVSEDAAPEKPAEDEKKEDKKQE